MGKPQSWKDILSENSNYDFNHKWQVVKVIEPKIVRIKETSDFGGCFGRSGSGGEVIKSPKIIHYICSECKITGTKNFDENKYIIIDKQEYRNLSCKNIVVRRIMK